MDSQELFAKIKEVAPTNFYKKIASRVDKSPNTVRHVITGIHGRISQSTIDLIWNEAAKVLQENSKSTKEVISKIKQRNQLAA